MTNREKFREVYAVKLAEAIARRPGDYHYGPDKIPGVVEKMIAALAGAGANLGPAVKAAARALGVKPTHGAIRAYLNEGGVTVRTTVKGAVMSPRMERLWAFIRDERGINLLDWSTDSDVEREQVALRAGERILEERLNAAHLRDHPDRDLACLLADYRAIMNRRPRERVA